jgi:hypothetical protein
MTDSASIVDDLREFVATRLGAKVAEISAQTCLVGDLKLLAPDLDELIEDFAERYGVDCSSYLWYHHTSPDGCNPVWSLIPPWWSRAQRVPLRVSDLAASAVHGKWQIVYPMQAIRRQPDYGTWVGAACLLSILVVGLLRWLS